jgi:MFS family permease
VLIVLILLLLKSTVVSSQPRVDFAGAVLMSASIVFLMFGLNLVSENFSARSLSFTVAFLLLSASMLVAFFHREKREQEPFFDLALLRSTPFLAANLLNMIIGAAVFGVFAFVPLYATVVHRLSTLISGMILTPRSFGSIPASAFTSLFLKKWGYRRPIVLGLVVVAVSTVLLDEGLHVPAMMGMHVGVPGVLSFIMLFTGIGMGIALPAANNACIELMPDRVATIVGLRGMFRTVGGALGISMITLILHLSKNTAAGFRITFVSFGLVLLVAIPLAFLMPSGRRTNRA